MVGFKSTVPHAEHCARAGLRVSASGRALGAKAARSVLRAALARAEVLRRTARRQTYVCVRAGATHPGIGVEAVVAGDKEEEAADLPRDGLPFPTEAAEVAFISPQGIRSITGGGRARIVRGGAD